MAAGHLLLIGGGHANLYVLARAAAYRQRGWRVTLLAPRWFYYSGLATSVVGGRVAESADRLDVAALAAALGVAHLADTLAALDPGNRLAITAGGQRLSYDLAAINIGSDVRPLPGAAGNPGVTPVKPLAHLLATGHALGDRLAQGEAPHAAVIGGGPSGVEIAGNLAGRGARVSLVSAAGTLLPGFPAGAGRHARRRLAKAGVGLWLGRRVAELAGAHVHLDDGTALAADHVVQATGLQAPAVLAETGLPLGPRGGLAVGADLASPADRRIFAAGDCSHFQPRPLPGAGVFGVRQAPDLHANLLASIDGTPRRAHRPQKRYLLIMALGDGTGLAVRGGLWGAGRWALRLKDRLDRPFVAAYAGLAAEAPAPDTAA